MEDAIFKELRTGKKHISFSELSDWNRCSFSHHLKFIKKLLVDEQSIFLTFGTAVHTAIESFLNTKTLDVNIALALLNEAYEKYGTDESFHRKNTLVQVTEQATRILSEFPAFLNSAFPGWEMIGAELPLYEPIDAHPEHAFKGFVDIIIRAPNKKGKMLVWVLDMKTTGSWWSREKRADPNVRAQLVLYKHFVAKKLNIPVKDIRCAFLLLKRKAKPGQSIEQIDVSVGDITVGRSLKVVNNMLASVQKSVAIKDRTGCDWCQFRDTEHCTFAAYKGRVR